MPITDIVIISIITFAFIAFAAVLAWGDHQTREIARASRERALSDVHVGALKRTVGADSSDRQTGVKGKSPAHA